MRRHVHFCTFVRQLDTGSATSDNCTWVWERPESALCFTPATASAAAVLGELQTSQVLSHENFFPFHTLLQWFGKLIYSELSLPLNVLCDLPEAYLRSLSQSLNPVQQFPFSNIALGQWVGTNLHPAVGCGRTLESRNNGSGGRQHCCLGWLFSTGFVWPYRRAPALQSDLREINSYLGVKYSSRTAAGGLVTYLFKLPSGHFLSLLHCGIICFTSVGKLTSQRAKPTHFGLKANGFCFQNKERACLLGLFHCRHSK